MKRWLRFLGGLLGLLLAGTLAAVALGTWLDHGPVYSIAQVQQWLAKHPQAWIGRTVRVRAGVLPCIPVTADADDGPSICLPPGLLDPAPPAAGRSAALGTAGAPLGSSGHVPRPAPGATSRRLRSTALLSGAAGRHTVGRWQWLRMRAMCASLSLQRRRVGHGACARIGSLINIRCMLYTCRGLRNRGLSRREAAFIPAWRCQRPADTSHQ
jgi:hypothetical protein